MAFLPTINPALLNQQAPRTWGPGNDLCDRVNFPQPPKVGTGTWGPGNDLSDRVNFPGGLTDTYTPSTGTWGPGNDLVNPSMFPREDAAPRTWGPGNDLSDRLADFNKRLGF